MEINGCVKSIGIPTGGGLNLSVHIGDTDDILEEVRKMKKVGEGGVVLEIGPGLPKGDPNQTDLED